MQSFFAMGGYAFYVWSAFTVTGVILFANVLWPLLQRRRMLRKQARVVSCNESDA